MSKRGHLVTLDNLHDHCKVTSSTNMPSSLVTTLVKRGASYGIIVDEKSIIKHLSGNIEAEVNWYNSDGKYLLSFRHRLEGPRTSSHLLHLTDGNFDIDHIDKLLDQLAEKL